MEVSRCPLTPDGWRVKRRGAVAVRSAPGLPAKSSVPLGCGGPFLSRRTGERASGVKPSSVIAGAFSLKFRSRFCRLFRGPVAERGQRRRRAGKRSDVESLSSCFDGVTCVICKLRQLFNELGDCKQMVAYTKAGTATCFCLGL